MNENEENQTSEPIVEAIVEQPESIVEKVETVAEPISEVREVESSEPETEIPQSQPEPEPAPEISHDPTNPNITIERKGDGVTITEIMQPVPRTVLDTQPLPSRQKALWGRFFDKLNLKKRKRLEKILQMLSNSPKITNDDVEKLLRVSDATATRYLDQLEKEGKVRQAGSGKYIYYEKI